MASEPQPVAEEAWPTRLSGFLPKPQVQYRITFTFCLIKEPYNEHDRDAIAVYAEDKKIGYVANSSYTKYEMTSSASELQDKFSNISRAEFLLYLNRYADIRFAIGRIVKE